MYCLPLQNGRTITLADLAKALDALQPSYDSFTHLRRMQHLAALERLGARGMEYSNQDFDVLSSALNFLDAVEPEHTLRNLPMCPDRWNRLYRRMLAALARIQCRFHKNTLKLRWLNWAERTTGTTCFFQAWRG